MERGARASSFNEIVKASQAQNGPPESIADIDRRIAAMEESARRANLMTDSLASQLRGLRESMRAELRSIPNQWEILRRRLEPREPQLYAALRDVSTIRDTERFLDAAAQLPKIVDEAVIPNAAREAIATVLADAVRVHLKELTTGADRAARFAEMLRARLEGPIPPGMHVSDLLVADLTRRFLELVPEKKNGEIWLALQEVLRLANAQEIERAAYERKFQEIVAADGSRNPPPESIAEIYFRVSAMEDSARAANLMTDHVAGLFRDLRNRMVEEFRNAPSRHLDRLRPVLGQEQFQLVKRALRTDSLSTFADRMAELRAALPPKEEMPETTREPLATLATEGTRDKLMSLLGLAASPAMGRAEGLKEKARIDSNWESTQKSAAFLSADAFSQRSQERGHRSNLRTIAFHLQPENSPLRAEVAELLKASDEQLRAKVSEVVLSFGSQAQADSIWDELAPVVAHARKASLAASQRWDRFDGSRSGTRSANY